MVKHAFHKKWLTIVYLKHEEGGGVPTKMRGRGSNQNEKGVQPKLEEGVQPKLEKGGPTKIRGRRVKKKK